jgi:hypothetical protein
MERRRLRNCMRGRLPTVNRDGSRTPSRSPRTRSISSSAPKKTAPARGRAEAALGGCSGAGVSIRPCRTKQPRHHLFLKKVACFEMASGLFRPVPSRKPAGESGDSRAVICRPIGASARLASSACSGGSAPPSLNLEKLLQTEVHGTEVHSATSRQGAHLRQMRWEDAVFVHRGGKAWFCASRL